MINIPEEKTNQTDQIACHLRDQESDVFPAEIPQGVHWTHDVTGEIFKFWSKVRGSQPLTNAMGERYLQELSFCFSQENSPKNE